MFEFRGIVCRHMLAILTQKKIRTVPSKYVLERWWKDIRRRHTYIAMNPDDLRTSPQIAKFNRLNKFFGEIVEMGSKSDNRCQLVMTGLGELRERIGKSLCDTNEPIDTLSVEARRWLPGCKPSRCSGEWEATVKWKGSRVDVAPRRKKESVRKKETVCLE